MSYLFGFTTFTFLQNGPESRSMSSVQGSDGENGMYLPLYNFFCLFPTALLFIFLINAYIILLQFGSR